MSKILNFSSEDLNNYDFSKMIALNFNENFGIKMEVGVQEVETSPSNEENFVNDGPFSEFNFIKSENIYPVQNFPDNCENTSVVRSSNVENEEYNEEYNEEFFIENLIGLNRASPSEVINQRVDNYEEYLIEDPLRINLVSSHTVTDEILDNYEEDLIENPLRINIGSPHTYTNERAENNEADFIENSLIITVGSPHTVANERIDNNGDFIENSLRINVGSHHTVANERINNCEEQLSENVLGINLLNPHSVTNKVVNNIDGNPYENIRTQSLSDNNVKSISNQNDKIQNVSSIGKVKKVQKFVELRKNEEKITAKSLLKINSSDKNYVDKIFLQLPVTKKIIMDSNVLSEELDVITPNILKSIVEKGNINLLQSYASSSQRETLQGLIQENPSILVLAAKFNSVHIVASILALGVDINTLDSDYYTALLRACDNENDVLIDLLVNNGAAMNLRRDGTNQVMFHCATRVKIRAITSLLNLGANFKSIQLIQPYSLENYAKQMNLPEISKVVENHITNLTKSLHENVFSLLGSHVRFVNQILPIHVYSLFEIEDGIVQLFFDADIPPVKPNHCNLLFLLTGLVSGAGMKCLNNDANKITSVTLNDVDQQSLLPGYYKMITSFSPLKSERNCLTIHSEGLKCRKVRLLLVAYNIFVTD